MPEEVLPEESELFLAAEVIGPDSTTLDELAVSSVEITECTPAIPSAAPESAVEREAGIIHTLAPTLEHKE